MSRVLWQSRTKRSYEYFKAGCTDNFANGGQLYEFQAMQVLAEEFDFMLDREAVQGDKENVLSYWWRLNRHVAAADVVIKDPQVIAFSRPGISPIEVGIVHHIDYSLLNTLRHGWLVARIQRQLRVMHAVVTVSRFWQCELEKNGCRNVEVIYNAFDPVEFEIGPADVRAFRHRYGLPGDRALIYVGNATRQKGVEEVYAALKDMGCMLVMTGRTKDVDISVPFYTLDRKDYLCLLHACDVVITMSSMLEGWNRVAHEAMLCGTPVIGSGSGGMHELLSGGGQAIVPDNHGLAEVVHDVISRKSELGRKGYDFVKQFDLDYFSRAWTSFIRRVSESVS